MPASWEQKSAVRTTAEILKKVREADALIMATPVYYGDVTGQLKLFIDRTSPIWCRTMLQTRLKAGFLPESAFTPRPSARGIPMRISLPTYSLAMPTSRLKARKEARLVRGCGPSEKSNPIKRDDLMAEADGVVWSG